MSLRGALSRVASLRSPNLAMAGVCGILGFLFITTSNSVTETRRAEEPRRDRLIELIQDRRRQVDHLDDAVRELRSRVAGAQQAASRVTASGTARADELARLGEQAGVTAVRGKGVEVRLSDSTRRIKPEDDAGAYRIHDRDLQLIVNALWAAGAEAVAVNDVRLVATSPIRAAGDTIVVSFRPLSPPYVVRAIGAGEDAFEKSDVARQFSRWRDVFGLGFRVRSDGDLHVPGFAGRVAVGEARTGNG